jgi:hypothetical protein
MAHSEKKTGGYKLNKNTTQDIPSRLEKIKFADTILTHGEHFYSIGNSFRIGPLKARQSSNIWEQH